MDRSADRQTRFIEALTRHQPTLEASCHANLGNRDESRGALQSTSVKLWENVGVWNPETELLPWAFAEARSPAAWKNSRSSSARSAMKESPGSELHFLTTKPIRRILILAILLKVLSGFTEAAETKPNIVIIVADDMGFSDAGCYGGEIHTPNLDHLAADGLRFTQFYNTARCWSSRASIPAGYYQQAIRRDNLTDDFGKEDDSGGTKSARPRWAHHLPENLKPLGYQSYHSGKWHVDGTPVGE